MTDDLVKRTRSLLRASKTPWPEIAAGAQVSLRWLYQFDEERRSNFTLRTVQSLHTYLAARTSRKSSAAAQPLASTSS